MAVQMQTPMPAPSETPGGSIRPKNAPRSLFDPGDCEARDRRLI